MQRDALRVPESLVWLEFRMQSCGLSARESFETPGSGGSVVHAREVRTPGLGSVVNHFGVFCSRSQDLDGRHRRNWQEQNGDD